jgi:hypothetical protein
VAKKNSGKTVKSVPLQYDPVDESVTDLAKSLIAKYHTHLINAQVAYLFRNKPMKKGDRELAATAEKVSAKNKVLSKYDFIITISYELWKTLSDAVKIAVLDHELTHCFITENEKTGETQYKILNHDVEEFGDVIRRNGLYNIDLVHIGNVIETAKIPDDLKKEVVVRKMGDPESAEIEDEVLEDKPKKKSLKIKKTKTKDSEDENDLLSLED